MPKSELTKNHTKARQGFFDGVAFGECRKMHWENSKNSL